MDVQNVGPHTVMVLGIFRLQIPSQYEGCAQSQQMGPVSEGEGTKMRGTAMVHVTELQSLQPTPENNIAWRLSDTADRCA